MYTPLATLSLFLLLIPAGANAQHDAHPPAADPADHEAHGQHAATTPVRADHVPWTPDPPLVEGMARVREAVATLAHHEMGHMGEPQVLALATRVDAAVAGMFANCKLDPEPDVALHGVLARLMAGTRALHANPADASPVADMRAALRDYGRLFADPPVAAQVGGDAGH